MRRTTLFLLRSYDMQDEKNRLAGIAGEGSVQAVMVTAGRHADSAV